MNKPTFSRKKARRLALQALYGWTLTQNTLNDVEAHFFLEHGEENFDKDYFRVLLHEIPAHLTELETAMKPYLSRPFEDLDPIELNVLRIASFEFIFRPEIPYRVVINEALELAKTFGATDSYKFINGVLDKMAKEYRKTEIS